MPSSIVYGLNSSSISNVALPSASAQVLMGWMKRTTVGISQENAFAFGLNVNNNLTEDVGNWGVALGESSGNHYVRLTATAWLATTQSISSSTDWYFAVLQRASGSATVNVRMFKDNGPTFTKDVDLTVGGSSEIRTANRIRMLGKDGTYQFTGIRYFTGSTFTDAQCREQATYRNPPTHPTASLYDYWILETATQLTGSVTGTILSGSAPALSASSAPSSIRPAQRLRYVNTNSTAGGNGTTNATVGATRAYASLRDAWLDQASGPNNTLLTTDQYLEIQCTGGPVDIDTSPEALYFQMTTDETRYALITAAPGQEATIPMNRNRYIFSGSFSGYSCRNLKVTNLQFEKSSSSGGDAVLSFSSFAESSSAVFANNTILQRGVGTAITVASRTSGSQVFLINNFITASNQSVYGMLVQSTSAPFLTYYVYNNTVVGGQRAYYNTFYGPEDSIYFKNNLGVNSSAACFGNEATPTTQSFENNASSDNTAFANTSNGATLRNRTFTFRNSQSGDYRLRGDDTGARRLGVNLSNDPYYPFTTDFFGQDRNRNGWWDIGADQADTGYGGATTTTVFFDNFDRANGNIGSNYATLATGSGLPLTVFNNQLRGPASSEEVAFSVVSSSVAIFSFDQQATIRYTALNPFDFAGPAVRVDPINGNAYFMGLDGVNAGGRRIARLDAGVGTPIGANVGIVPNVGDVFTLRAVGSLISAYRNGILIASASDATYTTGQPGVFYKKESGNNTFMDNFIASNISTTGGSLAVMTNTGSRGLVVGVT